MASIDSRGSTELVTPLPAGFACVDCASIPKDVPVDEVDAEIAEKLLSLPREIGAHPETGKPVHYGHETGELVLTTLGRAGSPMLRYRTGWS